MPQAAKRPCRKTGCPNLTDSAYCDEHRQPEQGQRELWRGSASSRGYDAAWKRIRLQALKRDYHLCQTCLRATPPRFNPAVDVDHVIPIRVAPDRRLDLSNLQSICRECHAKKTAFEKTRQARQLTDSQGAGRKSRTSIRVSPKPVACS
jgi:5-methylcytosine-specific restriction protein A